MRKAIVTFAFMFVAGCGGGLDIAPVDGGATGGDMPLPTCPTSCPNGCGAGEFCFEPAQISGVPALCARACTDTRDCAAGEKCAALFATMQPPVCVSDTLPALCGASVEPGWHCDFPPASCKDADTLGLPFSNRANRTCGWEYLHCDHGCDDSVKPAKCK